MDGLRETIPEEDMAALGTRIARGELLVHDGEKSHAILVERLGLVSRVCDPKAAKGKAGRDNPM